MSNHAAIHSPKSQLFPYLALGTGIICLTFSAILVRWSNAPGPVTSFYRMGIATAVLAWPFYQRIKTRDNLPRRSLQLAVIGGLFFGTDMALWSTGVVMSGATNPTLLSNIAPLWVGLGAILFFEEKLNLKFWTGLMLALADTAIILGLDGLRSEPLDAGSLLGLLSSVFYGGYFLITQRGRETLDSLTFLWPATASAAGGLFILNLILGYPLTGYSPLTCLISLALGLIPQVCGYLVINYALGYLPASVVSPTMLGQPAMTAVMAWLLLDEALSLKQILGGLTVLGGVYLVHHSRQKNQT